jgi:hypothetical protein
MALNIEFINILKENIIAQAKSYLTESGEFNLFSAAIDSNNHSRSYR